MHSLMFCVLHVPTDPSPRGHFSSSGRTSFATRTRRARVVLHFGSAARWSGE